MKLSRLKIKFASLVAMILLSSSALADGWSGWVKVDLLAAREDGSIWMNPSRAINPDACERGTWAIIESTHPGLDRFYSLLLTAKMGNLEVNYYVNGCSGRYPRMERINLR